MGPARLTSCHSSTPLQASSLLLSRCSFTASPPRDSPGDEGPIGPRAPKTRAPSCSRGEKSSVIQGWVAPRILEGTSSGTDLEGTSSGTDLVHTPSLHLFPSSQGLKAGYPEQPLEQCVRKLWATSPVLHNLTLRPLSPPRAASHKGCPSLRTKEAGTRNQVKRASSWREPGSWREPKGYPAPKY